MRRILPSLMLLLLLGCKNGRIPEEGYYVQKNTITLVCYGEESISLEGYDYRYYTKFWGWSYPVSTSPRVRCNLSQSGSEELCALSKNGIVYRDFDAGLCRYVVQKGASYWIENLVLPKEE